MIRETPFIGANTFGENVKGRAIDKDTGKHLVTIENFPSTARRRLLYDQFHTLLEMYCVLFGSIFFLAVENFLDMYLVYYAPPSLTPLPSFTGPGPGCSSSMVHPSFYHGYSEA